MHASCVRRYHEGESACLFCEQELDEWAAREEAERLSTLPKPLPRRLFS